MQLWCVVSATPEEPPGVMDANGGPRTYFQPDPAQPGTPRSWTTSMRSTREPYCRVCGYLPPEPPWGETGHDPTFEMCPCCGVEWGYQDGLPAAAAAYRSKWLAAGGKWTDKRVPSDGLEVDTRMRRVVDGD